MNIKIIPHKIMLVLELMRLNNPTGYLLPFFASCFGIAIAQPRCELFYLVPMFFLGSVAARSAGCIINDLLDAKFDAAVFRTKNRPLATGAVSKRDALIALFVMGIIAIGILFTLTMVAIYLGLVAILLISIYPLMKRITNFAQVFLGITFNFGVLIGYAAVLDRLELDALLMYAGCCFWTIGYDTIYGFMDLADDKRLRLKSMAILLEKCKPKLWLYAFYAYFIALFSAASYLSFGFIEPISFALAAYILFWQVYTLEIHNFHNCLERFKWNNVVGAALALSMVSVAAFF